MSVWLQEKSKKLEKPVQLECGPGSCGRRIGASLCDVPLASSYAILMFWSSNLFEDEGIRGLVIQLGLHADTKSDIVCLCGMFLG